MSFLPRLYPECLRSSLIRITVAVIFYDRAPVYTAAIDRDHDLIVKEGSVYELQEPVLGLGRGIIGLKLKLKNILLIKEIPRVHIVGYDLR